MTKSVAILGGGISGLSTAFHLLKHSRKVGIPAPRIKIFEAQNKFGGWMKSVKYGPGRDDFFDLGPRTIRTATKAGSNVIEMVSDIGLGGSVKPVTSKSTNFQRRFIAYKGELKKLPSNWPDLFAVQEPFLLFAKYLIREYRTPKINIAKMHTDISVDQFFRIRFGNDIADYIIDPMCKGITGGDSKALSMQCVFPDVLKGEQEYGSIVKWMLKNKTNRFEGFEDNRLVMKSKEEKWSVISFDGGIGTLSDRLAEYLADCHVDLTTGTPVESLKLSKDTCQVNDETFDHCFSSLPSFALSSLLSTEEKNKKLALALRIIPFVDMAVVSFRFPPGSPASGISFWLRILGPSREESSILGVIYDSMIFNSADSKFTVMLGGSQFRQLFGKPETVKEERLVKVSKEALQKYLKITQEPLDTVVNIHRQCIPQYNVGHTQKVERIEEYIQPYPISLIGSSYRGFSVPDCVLNAKLQANRYIDSLIV